MTVAARDRRDHLDPVTHRPVTAVGRVDVRTDLDDLTGDLMTDGARRRQVLVPVVEDLDVGTAGGAVAHPQFDLVWAALRLRDVFEPDILGGVETQGFHGRSFRSSAGSRSCHPISLSEL